MGLTVLLKKLASTCGNVQWSTTHFSGALECTNAHTLQMLFTIAQITDALLYTLFMHFLLKVQYHYFICLCILPQAYMFMYVHKSLVFNSLVKPILHVLLLLFLISYSINYIDLTGKKCFQKVQNQSIVMIIIAKTDIY